MHTRYRAGAFAVLVLLAGWFLSAPASARGPKGPHLPRDAASSTTQGLDLRLFGSSIAISSLTAAIAGNRLAKSSAEGVAHVGSTATTARVESEKKRQFRVACAPKLHLFDLFKVTAACGESRAQVLPELFTPDLPRHVGASLLDPATAGAVPPPAPEVIGGPQAVGRGSVAGIEVRDVRRLQPVFDSLRSLLDSIRPVVDQTVDLASAAIDPRYRGTLAALSAGLGPTSSVRAVATLIAQLLDGVPKATGLLSVSLSGSTATTNSTTSEIVALASAGGGHVDLLPGLAPNGAPLLSVIFSEAKANAKFNRLTSARSSGIQPVKARIQFGLPVAGPGIAEMELSAGSPVTVLGGTPLETTISLSAGQTGKRTDGAVFSSVDGPEIQLLKGVHGGIDLRLGHTESATGGRQTIPGVGQGRAWPVLVGAGLLLGADVILLTATLRRRAQERA